MPKEERYEARKGDRGSMGKTNMTAHRILTFLTSSAIAVLVGGCASTSPRNVADYLSAPSRFHFNVPVCFVVEDKRPDFERQGDSKGIWLYTVDGHNPNGTIQSLGIDLCKIMEHKGITATARVALPGEVPPTNCVLVRITLESWYGRVPNLNTITEQTIGAVLQPAIFVEGHCRFISGLVVSGQPYGLGVSEGGAAVAASRNATVAKEGNAASAIAADRAMVQFFQAFEKQCVEIKKNQSATTL